MIDCKETSLKFNNDFAELLAICVTLGGVMLQISPNMFNFVTELGNPHLLALVFKTILPH